MYGSTPSAMDHRDSKYPKIEAANAFKKEDNDRLFELFNSGEWETLNKSGLFKIEFCNPKKIMLQLVSVKKTVFKENKNRHEGINCFRIGYITQLLTIVDIEELVRVASVVLEIYE